MERTPAFIKRYALIVTTFFHVHELQALLADSSIEVVGLLCEEARWKLEALVPPACKDHVRTVVAVGKAAAEIVRLAKAQRSDLILLGGDSRRSWRPAMPDDREGCPPGRPSPALRL
jgi:nucleotide-binding universal stress UspA family protein